MRRRIRSSPEAGEPVDAHALAVRLLTRRDLSEAQLRARLLERVGPADAEAALARLKARGAVDDRRVAFAFARTAAGVKRRGPLRVRRELVAMGIEGALADEAVSAAFADTDDRALLDQAIERRLRGRPLDDPRAVARLAGALLRQGYARDAVAAALRRRRLALPDDR